MPDMTKNVLFEVTNRSIYPFDEYSDIVVEADNDSRRLTFAVPRYYDDIDFYSKKCMIRYINANQQYDEYNVTDLKAENNVVKFSWLVEDKVVLKCGEAEFDITFYDDNGYKWHTKPAKLKIEHGLLESGYLASGDYSAYVEWKKEAREAMDLLKDAAKNTQTAVDAASEAATSAKNAKTSETNAKTSETNASTSATNAKTSETNAKTSETNAKTYASQAQSAVADYYNKTDTDNKISAAGAYMYSATYKVDEWNEVTDDSMKQKGYAFLNLVNTTKDKSTDPDIGVNSVFVTTGAFTTTGNAQTDATLMEALSIINSGYTKTGVENLVSTYVTEKPESDITVRWAIKP